MKTHSALALLTIASWGLVVAAFERPEPLFLNLGAGDAPFARGFRGGWERDGLHQSGDTQFRWTLDGARLEFPVLVSSGHLVGRLRLARFAPTPAEVTLEVQKREVDRFLEPSRGWSVREVDLGEVRGPLSLRFRSRGAPDEMGVALDWVEVRGAGFLLPRPELRPKLLLFFLGLPLLAGLLARSLRAGLLAGSGLALLGAVAVSLDRLGGLVAASAAAVPGTVFLLAFGLLVLALRRFWPEASGAALGVPLAFAAVALLALFHPFYYYPDVDTHARFVSAIAGEPRLAWDPTPYQLREGTWTREIGGVKVAFPYSPVFHLLALPLSPLLSPQGAVKVLGVLAFSTSLLLVFLLARLFGMDENGALLAQGLAAVLPVGASRLSLALYPALLGEAAALLLALFLAGSGEATFGALVAAFTLAELPYVGSIARVGLLGLSLVLLERLEGRRRGRLLLALLLSSVLVFAILDFRFVPALFHDVLPHLRETAGKEGPGGGLSLLDIGQRVQTFFDSLLPLVCLPGAFTLLRVPGPARRIGGSLLASGFGLLVLRVAFPALFLDVKDVEALLAVLAIFAASGIVLLCRLGRPGRALGALVLLGIAWFSVSASIDAYAARFVALGR